MLVLALVNVFYRLDDLKGYVLEGASNILYVHCNAFTITIPCKFRQEVKEYPTGRAFWCYIKSSVLYLNIHGLFSSINTSAGKLQGGFLLSTWRITAVILLPCSSALHLFFLMFGGFQDTENQVLLCVLEDAEQKGLGVGIFFQVASVKINNWALKIRGHLWQSTKLNQV